jgi:hypothetical protein
MNEFLFGDLEGRHLRLFANDRETAIRFFHARVTDPSLYVPDSFIRTDDQGQWIGQYDVHMEMFVAEYTPDACVPVSMRVGDAWRAIGSIASSSLSNRWAIQGPRRLRSG